MQSYANSIRTAGKTTAFVPTMGYLHDGHLSLLKIGRQKTDNLVLSIFVNPAQFAPGEDLISYPRSLEQDLKLAKKEGVDVVFVPTDLELYQKGYQTYVELENLPTYLCGKSRPMFFRGVTTIVTQLFNIVKPDMAIFGEKDYQQLAIIRQMVIDLKFDIEIISGPIVREKHGLAMSSRNSYLTDDLRPAALSLFNALQKADEMVKKGVLDTKLIIAQAEKIILDFPQNTIDYITICDAKTLKPIDFIQKTALIALAVNLEKGRLKVRLIDNTILSIEGRQHL